MSLRNIMYAAIGAVGLGIGSTQGVEAQEMARPAYNGIEGVYDKQAFKELVVAGDFDGNGTIDLITGGVLASQPGLNDRAGLFFHPQNENGEFQWSRYPFIYLEADIRNQMSMVATDLNKDGLEDLVLTARDDGYGSIINRYILINKGNGEFEGVERVPLK